MAEALLDRPSKVTLKLLIDKKANKVLFAEAGKEAVDFLCSILTLPVGKVVRLLSKPGMDGCLTKLYRSIENLNDQYVQPGVHKNTVLKPAMYNINEQPALFLLTDGVAQKESKAIRFYRCPQDHNYVTSVEGTKCPACRYTSMTGDMTFVDGEFASVRKVVSSGLGRDAVTYMVMDDLEVAPMSTSTFITLLNKFSVKDVGGIEEIVVHLDMAKGLKLLKSSFKSEKVLTKVFL